MKFQFIVLKVIWREFDTSLQVTNICHVRAGPRRRRQWTVVYRWNIQCRSRRRPQALWTRNHGDWLNCMRQSGIGRSKSTRVHWYTMIAWIGYPPQVRLPSKKWRGPDPCAPPGSDIGVARKFGLEGPRFMEECGCTLRKGPLNTRRNMSVNRVLTDSTLPLTECTLLVAAVSFQ